MENISEIIKSCPLINYTEVVDIKPVTGDASGRQYFRLYLKDTGTLILVKLVPGTGPKHAGKAIDQNQAFIYAAELLSANDISYGKILYNGIRDSYFILEDLGDLRLAEHLLCNNTDKQSKLNYLLAASTLIAKLQKIKPKSSSLLARSMDADTCYFETSRFLSIYLRNANLNTAVKARIEEFLTLIVLKTVTQKQVCIHRDFMPWNLMIDTRGDLKLIDYQDLCIGSYAYDLMSLLHDRDIDTVFNDSELSFVINFFREKICASESFISDYYWVLLQRNLRLTGHFQMLTEKTGKPEYIGWVPGCLDRSARAIASLPELSEFALLLSDIIPGFKEKLVPYHL